jgi:hypothetical protein
LRSRTRAEVRIERPIGTDDLLDPVFQVVTPWSAEREPYHVALELPTGLKGDGVKGSTSAINEAMNQVLRGAAGFAAFVREQRLLAPGSGALIFPVIFTTARLSVTNTDLSSADIETGQLSSVDVEEPGWAWLQHNVSSSLLSAPAERFRSDSSLERNVGQVIRTQRLRSVAVVTSKAIESFLRTLENMVN